MKQFRAACLAMTLVLFTPAGSVMAAGAEDQQLETIQQQIDSSKANQERIAGEIAAAIKEQDEVSRRLVAISRSIQAQEAAVAASERELTRLAEDRVVLLANLGEKQDVLSELLAGLQRLERNPPPALVVEPGDILAALRGAMLLGTIVPELQGEADKLAAELDRLKQLETQISERRAAVAAEIARLDAGRTDLEGLVAAKKELVTRANADLAAEQERIAALGVKALSVKQLLEDIAAEKGRAEATAAKQRQQRDALERRRQEELQRRPRIVFAEARARLELPAVGQVVRHFGDPDGIGGSAQGMMIATRTGAQVTTPADGKVEFAGPFRTYGQVLILNPGGGFRVLLAGMDKVTAVAGEFLRAGEPVGVMGNGPASVTLFGDVVKDGRPVLYIEFRNNAEAIDSGPWWAIGKKEARG